MNDFNRVSIDLPVDLVQRSQRLIDQGFASDFDSLIVLALDSFFHQVERQEIDAQLANMANDVNHQALNESILREFEDSDWEALMVGEVYNQDS